MYYTRKTNYSHIKIIIDVEEIERVKMTAFETILFIIKRLSGIFTKDEKYLMEQKLHQPLEYYCKDGGTTGDKFYSLTQMRNLVKTWRKANVPDFSEAEYQKLVREVNEGLQKLSGSQEGPGAEAQKKEEEPTGPEVDFQANMSVTWTDQALSTLPMITAYLPGANGELNRHAVVIDTAASVSIISAEKYRAWGLNLDNLNKDHVFKVETGGGVVKTLGSWDTFVFCQSGRKFYKIPVTLLVLNSPIRKILFGINTLRRANYCLQYKCGEEWLKLTVLTSGNKWVTRSFQTFNLEPRTSAKEIYVSEVIKQTSEPVNEPVPVTFGLTSENLFVSDMLCDIFNEEGDLIMKNNYQRGGEIKTEVAMTDTPAGCWPTSAQHRLTVKLPREEAQAAELRLVGVPALPDKHSEDFEVLMAEAVRGLEEDEQRADELEAEGRDPAYGCDEHIYKRLGAVGLEPPPSPGEKYWEPDLTGLPDLVREKFAGLFEEFKDCFSPDHYTVPRARLPKIKLQLKPGAPLPQDRPRPLKPDHAQVMSEILNKMLAAGYIREITGQPHLMGPANHAVFLVPKKMSLGADQEVSTRYETQTAAQRLSVLRAGARFVSDFRSLNESLVDVSPLGLVSFDTEVRLYGGCVASTLDVCSGFYALELEEESKSYCQFVVGDRIFVYDVMPMGLKSSPGNFSYLMSVVVNKKSFDQYMVEVNHEETLAASFFKAVSRYIDDIGLLSRRTGSHGGYFLLYHIWKFILIQFRSYKITLSSKKIELGKHQVTLLGFNINLKTSSYSISTRRKAAFRDIKFPRSPAQLKCLLAMINYFDKALLKSKCLVTMLSILSNDKESYHYTVTHQREFLCLVWSFECNLSVKIPDPNQKLFLQTDSSFSAFSGCLYQVSSLADSTKTERDQPASAFDLAGIYSRSYKGSELSASIVMKEVHALMKSIEIFYADIVSNTQGCLIFVDFQSLTIIPRLKFANPKLHRYNMLLGSLPRVSLCVSKSATSNFLADLISRLSYSRQETAPELIPAKYLDTPGAPLPEWTVLSPAQVRYLVQMPLPDIFLACPRRTQIGPAADMTQLEEIIEGRIIPEESLMRAVFHGYDSIPAKSVVFRNPKTNKIISRGDYDKLAKDFNHDKIRQYLHLTQLHSHCSLPTKDYLLLARDFLHKLESYMKDRKLNLYYPALFSQIARAGGDPELTTREFMMLHRQITQENILQTDNIKGELFLVDFVSITQKLNSEVGLEATDNILNLTTTRDIVLGPSQTTALRCGLNIHSSLGVEGVVCVSEAEPEVRGFLAQEYDQQIHHLVTVLLHNAGDDYCRIAATTVVVRVKFHSLSDPCTCSEGSIMFVVGTQSTAGTDEVSDARVLFSELVKNDAVYHGHPVALGELEQSGMNHHRDILLPEVPPAGGEEEETDTRDWVRYRLDPTIKSILVSELQPAGEEETDRPEWATGEEDTNIPAASPACPVLQPGPGRMSGGEPLLARLMKNRRLASSAQPRIKDIPDRAYTNRLLFMGSLFGARTQILKKNFIMKLQESCPLLRTIKERVLTGQAGAFSLQGGVLYRHQKHRPQFKLQLCLDGESYRVAADSVHAAGRHLSAEQLSLYLNQYVWTPEYPKIIKESIAQCPACTFNTACSRKHYVNNPHRTGVASLSQGWSLDFLENLPRSRNNKKFLLIAVEESSGFTVHFAQEDLTAESTINSLRILFQVYPVPLWIRFDFAPCFSSKKTLDFLRKHRVIPRKQAVGRPEENGASERGVQLSRQLLSTIILHEGGGEWSRWDEHLVTLTQQYNNLIFYAHNQMYSRAFLFFGPLFHMNSYYNAETPSGASPDWADPIIAGEEERIRAFNRILQARRKFAEKYKIHEASFLVPGTLVICPMNKNEKRRRTGNAGTVNSVDTVYKVAFLNENSVRLIDIFTQNEVTKNTGDVKPLPSSWLSYFRKKNVLEGHGIFEQNIFKPGNSPLVKELERAEEDVKKVINGLEEVEEAGEEDETEQLATKEVMEEERDRLKALAEEEERQLGTVQEEARVDPERIDGLQQPRYSPRVRWPRKARPSVNLLGLGTVEENNEGEQGARGRRRVRWRDTATVVDFHKNLPVVRGTSSSPTLSRRSNSPNFFDLRHEDLQDKYYEPTLLDESQKPEPGLTYKEIALRDEKQCYVALINSLYEKE